MLNETFNGKKTYTAAIVAVLGAATAYFTGEVTMYQAIMVCVPAILAATLRHGIKTEGTTVATEVEAKIA